MGPPGLIFVSVKIPAPKTTQVFQNTCEFRCPRGTHQSGYMWEWDVGLTDAGRQGGSPSWGCADVGGGLESGVPSALLAEPLHLARQGDLTCASGSSPPYAVRAREQPTDPHSPGPQSP